MCFAIGYVAVTGLFSAGFMLGAWWASRDREVG